jgi:hypothetical protein
MVEMAIPETEGLYPLLNSRHQAGVDETIVTR